MNANSAFIQVQDVTGNWVTVSTTTNQAQHIFRSLMAVTQQYQRLGRAVDSEGSILQIM